MRLTRNYYGGSLKFFQLFQVIYLELDNANQTVVGGKEKVGQLNSTLHDGFFQNIRTTCKALALQTGNPWDYPNYLQSMITHYENIRNLTRNNNRTDT